MGTEHIILHGHGHCHVLDLAKFPLTFSQLNGNTFSLVNGFMVLGF